MLVFQPVDSFGWRRFGQLLLLQHDDYLPLDQRQLLLQKFLFSALQGLFVQPLTFERFLQLFLAFT